MSDITIPGKVMGGQRRIYMGLGEAVLRLIHVELVYATNSGTENELITERNLIVQALNQQYQLDLGFDCNGDAVPDTVEIFQQTAKTSCCRIMPIDGDDGKNRSGRRVEAMPDLQVVREGLSDLMTQTKSKTPPPEKSILSKAMEKAFGGTKSKETSDTPKPRGSRKKEE